ncbi:MAG: heme o synthase [Mariprofundaceae bacterium]|nr:heme o synthase [Mariprofundaceae bacterium]
MADQLASELAQEKKSILSAYISISKPGIVGLTLVVALAGMFFGNLGVMPHWQQIAWTFLTLGLITAGSCMLNNLYDRDIDKIMTRTSKRVMATNSLPEKHVLILSLTLIISSLFVMWMMVNPLSAIVTFIGSFGYVVVYTMWTKRTTPWANQLGGIAGAVPPLVGYAAVTGTLDAWAWIMFAIMVVWQQPHALALALKYRHEYAAANVPVIPVAHGVDATKKRIVIYNMILPFVAVLPYFYGMSGIFYLVITSILSAMFLQKSIVFLRSERDCDMRLFGFSLIWLIAVFFVMVVDTSF